MRISASALRKLAKALEQGHYSMTDATFALEKAAATLEGLKQGIADYMESEGCDCCRDIKAHKVHKERLAKLLFVPRYSDGDGFDFPKFRTKTNK